MSKVIQVNNKMGLQLIKEIDLSNFNKRFSNSNFGVFLFYSYCKAVEGLGTYNLITAFEIKNRGFKLTFTWFSDP